METLIAFTRISIWLFLWLLAITIAWKLLTNTMSLEGIVNNSSGEVSPHRVQLLLSSFAMAAYLISEVLGNPGEFPSVPKEFLAVYGGSNALYVAVKAKTS